MDQRTCRSYSLPCFSFPALVDGVNGDVVGGDGLQALHDGGGGRRRDLQVHFFPSITRNVLQPVVGHPTRRRHPRDFHGPLGLVRHCQLFTSSRGWKTKNKTGLSQNHVGSKRGITNMNKDLNGLFLTFKPFSSIILTSAEYLYLNISDTAWCTTWHIINITPR